jgi:hypothetical protein
MTGIAISTTGRRSMAASSLLRTAMAQAYPMPVAKVGRGLRRPGHVTPAWQRYLTDRSFRRNFVALGGGGNGTLDQLVEGSSRSKPSVGVDRCRRCTAQA